MGIRPDVRVWYKNMGCLLCVPEVLNSYVQAVCSEDVSLRFAPPPPPSAAAPESAVAMLLVSRDRAAGKPSCLHYSVERSCLNPSSWMWLASPPPCTLTATGCLCVLPPCMGRRHSTCAWQPAGCIVACHALLEC